MSSAICWNELLSYAVLPTYISAWTLLIRGHIHMNFCMWILFVFFNQPIRDLYICDCLLLKFSLIFFYYTSFRRVYQKQELWKCVYFHNNQSKEIVYIILWIEFVILHGHGHHAIKIRNLTNICHQNYAVVHIIWVWRNSHVTTKIILDQIIFQ